MEWDPPDTTYKDELRMDLRAKTVKLRRHTEKFHGIVFGTDFLDITAKAVATKEKKNRFRLHQVQKLCASKDTTGSERHGMGWEKACKSWL